MKFKDNLIYKFYKLKKDNDFCNEFQFRDKGVTTRILKQVYI
jgi:hypothetical protein